MICSTTLREPLICSRPTTKEKHHSPPKLVPFESTPKSNQSRSITLIAFDHRYPNSIASMPGISTAAMDTTAIATTAEMGKGKGKGKDVSIMLTSGASGRINALLSLRAWKSLMMLIYAVLLLLLSPFRRKNNNNNGTVGGKVVIVPARKGADKDVPARRALAIRRAVQEGEDEKEETIREYSLLSMPRGDTMFTQSWTPLSRKFRGLVVILHGLNEHSGRYTYLAKLLNKNGFKVYAMDWIGHGGSDGLHAYVPSLDYAVSDLKFFLERVLAENPGLPCFCFGHSTGGAIILKAALDPKVSSSISGVVLTSPAVGVQPSHPIFSVLAPIFAFLLPRYQLTAATNKSIVVSRDPQALAVKYSDPLVFTGSIRVRTGYEILKISAFLQENLCKLTVPFLVLHGTADSVTDPNASQTLYREAASSDKNIKLYEGLVHDLLYEPEKEDILKDIIGWLNSRVQC